jgi:hypothetical protein
LKAQATLDYKHEDNKIPNKLRIDFDSLYQKITAFDPSSGLLAQEIILKPQSKCL